MELSGFASGCRSKLAGPIAAMPKVVDDAPLEGNNTRLEEITQLLANLRRMHVAGACYRSSHNETAAGCPSHFSWKR